MGSGPGGGLGIGLNFPAAAEGFVEGDEVDGDGAVAVGELVLGGVEGAFGVEDVEEAGDAVGVAIVGELEGLLAGIDGLGEGLAAGLLVGVGDEGVLDIGEGAEDGALVIGKGLFLEGVLDVDLGADFFALEERPVEAGADGPEFAAAVEEGAGVEGLEAGGAGEVEFGEEVGGGGADEGGLRGEFAFGLLDVGAAAEQIGRQADGDLRRRGWDGRDGGQFAGERARRKGEEETETVDGDLNGTLQGRNGGLGGGEKRGSLRDIEVAGEALVVALAGEVEGVLLGGDVLFGDGETLLGGAGLDVAAGDLAEEGDEDVAPAEFGGGELGVGGFDVAAVAAEDVDFPGSIEARLVEVERLGDAGREREVAVFADPLAGVGTVGVEGGQESGRGNARLGAGLADAGLGDFEVEVGGDGAVDEGVEFGIVEGFPPRGDGIGLGSFAALEGLAPLGRSVGGGWRFVIGADGAAGEERGGDGEWEKGRGFHGGRNFKISGRQWDGGRERP